ncbi:MULTISPECIES: helix-turn-helix domain-containing protein [unclassified Mesorhizobium]|uniref:helix-turn-helix transcriptional regulator n=1 Tax=unclassified Mesorhizobium TaxID=325217 RepID=UPI000F765830|nr:MULTISPECIES: helix-turn-helix domain-containing protein [unclassified Mesorhizobium]TGT59531.1 helix-turn-helix domain-containing protein [Mesorhizobium sp. M00.F.Ca.ET.170.01.1.1]AZO12525.1 helix-turn-helix domain-containing protein [Mesorhizobium sp. M3A.F.Ca.ET.080.04.2.1]RWB68423.1 MAG: helix-turn-helix domain-containing protein [Mesorhizobium sp.]RWB91010.1 MAG: helix-turn-helix domain-containing protein [Mesorhizobium sp.]RWE23518.1 MAG: helix-turn-helix domain-containing protein [Me
MDYAFEAYSIPEFCAAHRISRATFYNLINAGTAPRTMKVGGRVLISKEAAADWRKACETSEAA